MSRKALLPIILAAGLLPVPRSAMSQIGGGGSIQGVVSDPSGAVIPGAAVVAQNLATGVRTTRQTTEAGYYVLAPLPAGEYSVTATADGFQTLVQQKLVVDALSTVGLNLTLKIGAANEQVTVTDTPPALNTSDARVGETLRNEVYTALPLQMGGSAPRDPTAFAALLPGVTGFGGNTAGSVNGAQGNSQDVYVEGMPITNAALQGEVRNLGLGVSVEAVDQFQLESAGAAVEYGGQGATNYVIKSGTNKFHGTTYEYFRNTDMDARGFFAKTRPPEHQNEFGFNLGGPIRRNRIFFFGSYDGFRYITSSTPTLVSIPTPAERSGDFSQVPAIIYDPQSTVVTGTIPSRLAFPGNIIPANRISSASKLLQADLPAPTNSSLLNNYLGSLPNGFKNDNTTDKVDFNLSEKSRLFVLYSRGRRGQVNLYRGGGNSIPLPYTDTRVVNEIPTTAQIKHTYVISGNLVNQVSFSFSRLWVPITNATIEGDWMTKAGVKGLPAGEAASSFPEVAFNGANSPGGWRGTNSRAFVEALNDSTVQDNLQWTRAKHSITFGIQLQKLQANELTDAYGSLATWNFSNAQTEGFSAAGTPQSNTGNSYASYLLGALNGASVTQDSVVGTGARYTNYAWWVQDNYKLTPRLTLNLGLRHDIMLPYVEVKDRESFFNPGLPNPAAGGQPGILMFYGNGPDSCGCRTNIATHYLNFGPRLGLAFSLNAKTVLRAGYTIMYTHRGAVGGRGGGRTGTGTLGFSASPSFTSPNGYTPAFYWDAGVPPYLPPPFFDPTLGTTNNGTTTAAAGMSYGDPASGGKPPRYQNWNFGIQRSITNSLTLTANYVGSNGHFLGGGGRGFWSDQILPAYIALGNLLSLQATPANLAAARAIMPGLPGLPYPAFSGASATIAQMLRPFPQYSGVSDLWGDVANSNYNSLQVIANQRLSHGLVFNVYYTYAKELDDTGGSGSAYNWKIQKAQSTDPAHVLNVLWVYRLPFGTGHRLGGQNAFLQRVVSNWQLSGITQYRSGSLVAGVAANCTLPQFVGSCLADYNPGFHGPVILNPIGSGDVSSAVYLDKNAWQTPAAYTYGNTPRAGSYNLRGPSSSNQNVSLKREFGFRERWKLAFQIDAFNAFNGVQFGLPSVAINSTNFGKITSQSNSPRVVQLNARVSW